MPQQLKKSITPIYKTMIKQAAVSGYITVINYIQNVIILPSKLYKKLLQIINVDSDITDQLLSIYSEFIEYTRKK